MYTFDKLEMALCDLDFDFSVIALTETWNAYSKKSLFRPDSVV